MEESRPSSEFKFQAQFESFLVFRSKFFATSTRYQPSDAINQPFDRNKGAKMVDDQQVRDALNKRKAFVLENLE